VPGGLEAEVVGHRAARPLRRLLERAVGRSDVRAGAVRTRRIGPGDRRRGLWPVGRPRPMGRPRPVAGEDSRARHRPGRRRSGRRHERCGPRCHGRIRSGRGRVREDGGSERRHRAWQDQCVRGREQVGAEGAATEQRPRDSGSRTGRTRPGRAPLAGRVPRAGRMPLAGRRTRLAVVLRAGLAGSRRTGRTGRARRGKDRGVRPVHRDGWGAVTGHRARRGGWRGRVVPGAGSASVSRRGRRRLPAREKPVEQQPAGARRVTPCGCGRKP
jgi:hypothetical protein